MCAGWSSAWSRIREVHHDRQAYSHHPHHPTDTRILFSNVLLMLVPFMPSLTLAVALLLLRFSISEMDVPTRQSYVMALVEPDERSAASGITGVARTIGASLSPVLTGFFLTNPAFLGLPFVISGSLKIIYDLALYFNFRALKPPEEQTVTR